MNIFYFLVMLIIICFYFIQNSQMIEHFHFEVSPERKLCMEQSVCQTVDSKGNCSTLNNPNLNSANFPPRNSCGGSGCHSWTNGWNGNFPMNYNDWLVSDNPVGWKRPDATNIKMSYTPPQASCFQSPLNTVPHQIITPLPEKYSNLYNYGKKVPFDPNILPLPVPEIIERYTVSEDQANGLEQYLKNIGYWEVTNPYRREIMDSVPLNDREYCQQCPVKYSKKNDWKNKKFNGSWCGCPDDVYGGVCSEDTAAQKLHFKKFVCMTSKDAPTHCTSLCAKGEKGCDTGCTTDSYENMINSHTNNPDTILPGVYWKNFPLYRWKPLNETKFPNNSSYPSPDTGSPAGVNILDPDGSPQLLSDVNTCTAWAKRCCDPRQIEWCNTKLTAGGPPYKIAAPWMPAIMDENSGAWNKLRWRHQNDPMYEEMANMFLTFDNEDTDAICKTAIDDKTGEEYKLTCLQQMQEKLCYKDNFFECRKGHRIMPPWEDRVSIEDV